MQPPEFSFQGGFEYYASANPNVGDPTSAEFTISPSYTVQETTNGLLVYSIPRNLVDFADFTLPTETPPIELPPSAQLTVIDVSNHQSWANHPDTARHYLASLPTYPTRAIVRLASYLEPTQLYVTAIQQLQTFATLDLEVQAYVWCYNNADARREMDYANQQVIESQIPYLDTIWQDHEEYEGEPGPSTEWAIEAASYLVSQLGYLQCGIYTGKYYWDDHHHYGLPSLPLWVANYNPYYTIDTVPLPNGWTSAQGWQFTDSPVDTSTFRS